MGSTTNIEWTDATWNPIRGCSRVSEGCRNCYAEKVAYRFSGPGQPYEGLAKSVNGHASWTGEVRLIEEHLLDPLKWGPMKSHSAACERFADARDQLKLQCICGTRPRRIFVNSMSDLFHENVPDEWIDRIFAVMALCSQHQFQILTKRPERMLKYFAGLCCGRISDHIATLVEKHWHREWIKRMPRGFEWNGQGEVRVSGGVRDYWPLPNVWLGVSDEGNRHERIDILRQVPAVVRFISAEPLIFNPGKLDLSGISWVIVGGESGPNARPMHPDWARSLRDQCQAAGVPFFFKQWGEWTSQLPPDHGIPTESVRPERVQWMNSDGRTAPCGNSGDLKLGADNLIMRVGKKAAGALLDGREWREFPEEPNGR